MRWSTTAIAVLMITSNACAQNASVPAPPHPTPQISLPRVEFMPNEPPGFKLLDFAAIARGYDDVVLGPDSKLRWWDDTHVNISTRGIGLPSYVEHPEMKGGNNHEAITVLASILGSTLVGLDKHTGPDNLAALSAQYFNCANGINLVLNRVSTKTGQSYWYELFPQILFDAIAVRYPQEERLGEITDIAARRWLEAFDVLAKDGSLSFEHVAFDFEAMKPVQNGKHREPDAAAGLAYLFYNAYARSGEKRFLNAANACLKTLEERDASPSYEVLIPL